jgi:hypothetical protein
MASVQGRAELSVTPEPVTVVPTPFPADPSAPLFVAVHLKVDINSAEFRELNETLNKLVKVLDRSNAITPETGQQSIAEIKGGQEVLKSPKPNPGLVKVLLVAPLKYFATKLIDNTIQHLATKALEFITRLFTDAGIPL